MINDLSYRVIGCALEVFKTLGPGLLESAYEQALMYEFELKGIKAQNQVPIDINYKGKSIGNGLRLDIIVEERIIIELKSVENLQPIHFKQLQTYLKLTGLELGILINFNEMDLMSGLHRIANKLLE